MFTRIIPLRGCLPVSRFLSALALCAIVGCGGKTEPQTFPVEGAVRWRDGTDAAQLAGGTIEFESSGNVAAKAKLISDGTFTLNEPLPPGTYRLRVVPPSDAAGLDARFQKFETSKLSVTIGSEPKFVTLSVARRGR